MSAKNKGYQALRTRYSKDESNLIDTCIYCDQPLHHHEDVFHFLTKSSCLCGDCLSQLVQYQKEITLESLKIYVMYEYTTFLEGMIFQFKEGHDIALRDVFFYDFRNWFRFHYRHWAIVLLPSSKEKMMERSFLPVKEMLSFCDLTIIEPFYKNRNYKQSLQHIEKRKQVHTIIKRNPQVKLPDKPLLLVDDVCTSGHTLLAAYDFVKGHPYPIEAFVLAAHPQLLKQCESQ